MTQNTDDHRDSAFLFQRLFVLIQYGDCIGQSTLANTTPDDEM